MSEERKLNGNSDANEANKEQLKHKTGEKIVNADIASQMKALIFSCNNGYT